MQDAPRDSAHDLGDGTPASLEALQRDGVLSISGPGSSEAEAFALEIAKDVAAYDAELIARDGPEAMTSDRLHRQAALRAEHDPERVGYVLAAFRERKGWTRDQLAAWLDLDAYALDEIAGEYRPDRHPDLGTVHQLAGSYRANGDRLALVLSGGCDGGHGEHAG